MAHKELIGGTAYDTKGGRCLINGTGYSIKKGRTLIGGTGYDIKLVSYDPVFANNDWSTIIAACQANAVPDTWIVGNSKAMTINGTSYTIDIIGKNHDTYTAGGTAPLTLQMHDCYGTNYRMNSTGTNVGGYGNTEIHTISLPSILSLMPSEVISNIQSVNKLTSAGNKSTTIETISCKLFLLSEIEIFGRNVYSLAGEGTQYEYYSLGYSEIKKRTNTAIIWHERSPSHNDSVAFGWVTTSGDLSAGTASYACGVSFAFCF
jgi:hypothetical protein